MHNIDKIKPKANNQNRPYDINTKNVVFLVIDGLGARYIESLGDNDVVLDGIIVEKANFGAFFGSNYSATTVEQIFTETISAHSLYYIAGDCNKQWGDIKSCVDDTGITTICDLYKSNGYICIMVSEAGDFREARNEFDVVFYDSNFWEFKVELNSQRPEAYKIADFLSSRINKADGLKSYKSSEVGSFVDYSFFIIETDVLLIEFIRENLPSTKFFIFSNAKGIDLCGHKLNPKDYLSCIEGLGSKLSELQRIADENTVLFVTADHGMVFNCLQCRGHHTDASNNHFAREIPFIYIGNQKVELQSGLAYDIMPTVFELSGFSGACNLMRYCKGNSLVVNYYGS
ncbi:MAG: hypothetical protein QXM75_04030 [Candidatus Diapherotrites archaeon]